MLVLITYDVSTKDVLGEKRLRHVAKACENYGQRVQNSVFECLVDPAQLARLKDVLLRIIDPSKDSIRIYRLGKNWKPRVEQYGIRQPYIQEEPMIL